MNLHQCGWAIAFTLFGCTDDADKMSPDSGTAQVRETGLPPTDDSGTAPGDDTGTAPNDDTGTAPDDDTGEPEPAEPTVWTGPRTTFTKANFADPTDPANPDAITDAVVLTRGGRGSLINVVVEASASGSSPSGTEWAVGTTDALEGLEFKPLKQAANNQMANLPGTTLVLHLIDDDIYLDVTFLSWTRGSDSGGGFSYERATQD